MTEWTLTPADSQRTGIYGWSIDGFQRDGPAVVMLHGAGGASSDRLRPLAMPFLNIGSQVISFDFPGHGKSGQPSAARSLESRFAIAREVVLAKVPSRHALVLMGFSMSAHTTLRLTQLLGPKVAGIALMCPAVYSPAAEVVPFGAEFSAVIREEGSWRSSPAFEWASEFRGRALVMIGSEDAVIPWEVVEGLMRSLRLRASRTRLEVVRGADHQLALALGSRPDLQEQVADFFRVR